MLEKSKFQVLHANVPDDAAWAQQLSLYLSVAIRQIAGNSAYIELTQEFNLTLPTFLVLSDASLSDAGFVNSIKKALNTQNVYGIALLNNNTLANITVPTEIPIFRFFDWDNELGQYGLFATLAEGSAQQQFCSRVLDMALHIASTNKTAQTRKAYVAETSADQFRIRDLIVWELEKRGFNALPHIALNNNQQNILHYFNNKLEGTELLVHIVGNMYAPTINGQDMSVVEWQLKLSSDFMAKNKELGKTGVHRIIWLPPNFNATDVKQNQLVQRIKNDERDPFTDILQAPVDDLLELIVKKTSTDNENPLQKTKSNSSDISYYLIYDAADLAKAQIIREYLQTINVVVNEPLLQGGSAATMRAHRNYLVSAQSVIVLHASGSRLWLQSKIKDIQKAPGYGRVKPFKTSTLINASGSESINVQLPNFINLVNVEDITGPVIETCFKNLTNE